MSVKIIILAEVLQAFQNILKDVLFYYYYLCGACTLLQLSSQSPPPLKSSFVMKKWVLSGANRRCPLQIVNLIWIHYSFKFDIRPVNYILKLLASSHKISTRKVGAWSCVQNLLLMFLYTVHLS